VGTFRYDETRTTCGSAIVRALLGPLGGLWGGGIELLSQEGPWSLAREYLVIALITNSSLRPRNTERWFKREKRKGESGQFCKACTQASNVSGNRH
jgi:hypothetical protein